jgi:hypothetical protein
MFEATMFDCWAFDQYYYIVTTDIIIIIIIITTINFREYDALKFPKLSCDSVGRPGANRHQAFNRITAEL